MFLTHEISERDVISIEMTSLFSALSAKGFHNFGFVLLPQQVVSGFN